MAVLHSTYSCNCVDFEKDPSMDQADHNPGQVVCGSNGKTYKSDCHLFCECQAICDAEDHLRGDGCAQECTEQLNPYLFKRKDGKCGVCRCTRNLRPSCGSDDVTYGNDCELNCRKEKDLSLTRLYSGKCNSSSSNDDNK